MIGYHSFGTQHSAISGCFGRGIGTRFPVFHLARVKALTLGRRPTQGGGVSEPTGRPALACVCTPVPLYKSLFSPLGGRGFMEGLKRRDRYLFSSPRPTRTHEASRYKAPRRRFTALEVQRRHHVSYRRALNYCSPIARPSRCSTCPRFHAAASRGMGCNTITAKRKPAASADNRDRRGARMRVQQQRAIARPG